MPEPPAPEMNAAMLDPDRHEMELLDMRFDGDLEGRLAAFGPDLVAVTALTTEVYSAQDVLQRVKQLHRTS